MLPCWLIIINPHVTKFHVREYVRSFLLNKSISLKLVLLMLSQHVRKLSWLGRPCNPTMAASVCSTSQRTFSAREVPFPVSKCGFEVLPVYLFAARHTALVIALSTVLALKQ